MIKYHDRKITIQDREIFELEIKYQELNLIK